MIDTKDFSIGSCFIGVVFDIVNNCRQINNKFNNVWMFDLGFGQWLGDVRELNDTHETLDHYDIILIKDIRADGLNKIDDFLRVHVGS